MQIFRELTELEEQKTNEALEPLGRKHQVGTIGKRDVTRDGAVRGRRCQFPQAANQCPEQHVLPLFLARSQPAGIELRNKKKSEECQEDVEKIKKKKNQKDRVKESRTTVLVFVSADVSERTPESLIP